MSPQILKHLRPKIIQSLLLVTFLSLHLFIFYKIKLLDLLSGQTPMLDFDAYWYLAKAILNGQHPYQVNTMQTAGPPLVILPFIHFGLLPIEWGRITITILNIISASCACYLLAKKISTKYYLLTTSYLSFLLWISFPARFSLSLGQPNLIIMFLITILLLNKNKKIKGLTLFLLTIFKTFFAFTVFSLLKKNIKTLFWLLAFSLIFFIFSLQLIKPMYYQDFISHRLASTMLTSQEIKDVDYYNQSLKTTMSRFHLGDYYSISYILIALLAIIYLIKSANLEAGIIISVLLSPLVWQHYFVYLFPIYILLGNNLIKQKKWNSLIIWLLAFGFYFPEFSWLQNQPVTLINSLIASHFLISALLLLALIATNIEEKLLRL